MSVVKLRRRANFTVHYMLIIVSCNVSFCTFNMSELKSLQSHFVALLIYLNVVNIICDQI